MNQLHVVLGADGAMGRATAEALRDKHLPLRLVGRTAKPGDPSWSSADMLDSEQAKQAVAGASHVYLCIGLPYSASLWAEQWPKLMKHVIDACSEQQAVLVFLDNIYMYGPAPLPVPFDESTNQQPPSAKGRVRKEVADMMLAAMAEGTLQGVVGRSADFYGPGAKTSMLYNSFLERMLAGKTPYSLGPSDLPHSYAYTRDNGRALVELACDPTTYGQVWHLPVGEPLSNDQAAAYINDILHTQLKPQRLPTVLRKLAGLFVPVVREIDEMMYEYSEPYIMSDAKFRAHFPNFATTPYTEGLKAMVDSFRTT